MYYYYPHFVVSNIAFGNGALGPGIAAPQGPGQIAFAHTIYGNTGYTPLVFHNTNYPSGPVRGIGGKRS